MSSCRQLFRPYDHLTRSLRSSPITNLHRSYGSVRPSALHRFSPRGFRRLNFSLGIRATGSCSSARPPTSASRPLNAGRHLPSHQAPDRLFPGSEHVPGFDDTCIINDASSKGSLSFVSRMLTCTNSRLALLLQRSPPRLLIAAARSGLRPAPESRSRGTYPHQSRSLSTRFISS